MTEAELQALARRVYETRVEHALASDTTREIREEHQAEFDRVTHAIAAEKAAEANASAAAAREGASSVPSTRKIPWKKGW